MKPLGLGWPNVISIARIALIPVIVAMILREETVASWVALVVFIAGAASDGLDGYLARRHAMVSTTGAWLDPLSDKLFVAGPAFALSVVGAFPWWATIIIIARELAVQALRWRLDARAVSMPASKTAKLKTVLQLVAVGMAMAPMPSWFEPLTLTVTVVAVGLTVYSGGEYFLTSRHRVEVP